MKIKEIRIKNYKNLEDVTIRPERFNVLIGPNASGKTNFIEFFKILSGIFKEKKEPFREFGGYRKIVTNHETERNLEFYMEYETTIKGKTYNCIYELSFRTNNGFDVYIIKEEFRIPKIKESSMKHIYKIKEETPILVKLGKNIKNNKDLFLYTYKLLEKDFSIKIPKIFYMEMSKLYSLLSNSVFLFNIDFFGIRNSFYPFLLKKEKELDPYARNLFNILANIYFENQALPSNIEYVLNHYFKIKRLVFEPDFEGYMHINVEKKDYIGSIKEEPNGLIKTLAILCSINLLKNNDPGLIFIDEIENSLHPELLEFLIEELKESKNYIFLASHNPLVTDSSNPEEIQIFKIVNNRTTIRKLTDYKTREELEKELESLGIRLSDKVFYGLP